MMLMTLWSLAGWLLSVCLLVCLNVYFPPVAKLSALCQTTQVQNPTQSHREQTRQPFHAEHKHIPERLNGNVRSDHPLLITAEQGPQERVCKLLGHLLALPHSRVGTGGNCDGGGGC